MLSLGPPRRVQRTLAPAEKRSETPQKRPSSELSDTAIDDGMSWGKNSHQGQYLLSQGSDHLHTLWTDLLNGLPPLL